MFILEEPYVSGLLSTTAAASGRPILCNPMAVRTYSGQDVTLATAEEFVRAYDRTEHPRVYSNSENAIGWIAENLRHTPLPGRIDLFKDKVRFRELVADLYPDYRFREVTLAGLDDFDPASLRAPFVIKPAVGFFSVGVHVVDSPADWPGVVARIRREVDKSAKTYPEQVLGMDRFIAEEVIEGDEYAVDAFFDSEGRPVVVDIYGHLFASADDVSDRVYYTSVALIERFRRPFEEFLGELGKRAGLVDFPVHAELRVDAGGRIAPIEINPMRFGGWCATDMAHFAYDVNPYLAYLDDVRPDWERIACGREDEVTALIVADLPPSMDLSAIGSVDYDAFAARFSRVLELRPTDFNRYPVFAFTFVRVPANDLGELNDVLGADLTQYVRAAH